jgi:hypothetical protein
VSAESVQSRQLSCSAAVTAALQDPLLDYNKNPLDYCYYHTYLTQCNTSVLNSLCVFFCENCWQNSSSFRLEIRIVLFWDQDRFVWDLVIVRFPVSLIVIVWQNNVSYFKVPPHVFSTILLMFSPTTLKLVFSSSQYITLLFNTIDHAHQFFYSVFLLNLY